MKYQVDDIKFESLMMRIALNNVKEKIFEYMTEKHEKEGNEVIDETLADALLWIERGLAQGKDDSSQN